LFAYVAGLVKEHDHVLDVGTGNGQAAVKLADYFTQVTATDVSPQQIEHAIAKPNISYYVAPAESSGLPDQSVNLVTVATAAHWFATEKFYAEVRRVIKPGGAIAIWAYYIPTINPTLDEQIKRYYFGILDKYWSPETYHARCNYRTLLFPFQQIQTPVFTCSMEWELENLIGFFRSFSPATVYVKEHGSHPVEIIADDLQKAWGKPETTRVVQFPIFTKFARL
jgi:SAM-dependent methyltransferase